MTRLTKRQQKKLKYFLKEKADRRKKVDMLHDEQIPKYIEKQIPLIRKLARNLDQIMIVSSFVSPPVKTGLIDRFLVLSELEKLRVLICFNKTDLLDDPEEAEKSGFSDGETVVLRSDAGHFPGRLKYSDNIPDKVLAVYYLREEERILAGAAGISALTAAAPGLIRVKIERGK